MRDEMGTNSPRWLTEGLWLPYRGAKITGGGLTGLGCKAWPVPETHCPLVMLRGVFGCPFILNFLSSTMGRHLPMPANLYVPMK